MGNSRFPVAIHGGTCISAILRLQVAIAVVALFTIPALAQQSQGSKEAGVKITGEVVRGLRLSVSQPVRTDALDRNAVNSLLRSKGSNEFPGVVNNPSPTNATQGVSSILPGMTIMPGTGPASGYLSLTLFGISPIPGMGDTTIVDYNVPSFEWAGKSWTRVGVASDGYVVIGGAAYDTPANTILPNAAAPLNMLAPFWTDLNPALGSGGVRIGTLTSGGNSWLVVDWNSVEDANTFAVNSFEVWILLGGVEGITFSYNTISNGNNGLVTIGAQDSIGGIGTFWDYNGSRSLTSNFELLVQTAAFVADKSALTFGNVVETQSSLDSIVVHNPDLLTLEVDAVSVIGTNATEFTASPSSGTVSAGGSMTFYVTFTPTSPGSKSASVRFLHNAPGAAYSVSLSGTGISAAATIASVSDLPLDQGGTVVVNWNKSPLDRSTSTIVNSYLVWRGIEAASVPSAANVVDRNEYVKRVGRNGPTPELFMSTGARHDMPTVAGNVYWQYLTSLPSHGLDHYSYAAATLADSVSAGIPWRYFFITASTADANVYWDSSPDSGYSVDNLAPSTPGGAALAPMPNGPMQITWNADRTDPDVGQYNVYRSTVSGFSIGPSSFLKSTKDTLVVDSTTAAGGTYYYRVSTVDIHGNMSVPTSQLGNTALALELASFTAVAEGSDGVVLSWTTATETSVYGYTVERRKDGDPSFEPVANAFIAGHGTSTDPHTYAFRDATAPAGVIWYRIKQADLNGTARYSLSVEVNLAATELAPNVFQLMQNYPNPFNPATEIKFSVAVTARTTVDVYNTLGQRVAALFDGIAQAGQYYRATLGGANLASGLYFARLQSGSSVATRKMMLLK